MKLLRAIFLVLLSATALAQSASERVDLTATSTQTLQFNDGIGSGMRRFEFKIAGSPTTASIVLSGCMRGGTCDTIETSTSTSSSTRQVSGVYDYFTVRPVFTGGTSPSVQVFMSAVPRSASIATVADPCQSAALQYESVSGTASARLVSGVVGKKVVICAIVVVAGGAQNIAIVEGTGSTCGTGTAKYPGLSGGTTAATGWNLAANGGLTYGSGDAAVGQATTTGDDVCALLANAVQTNIGIKFVIL